MLKAPGIYLVLGTLVIGAGIVLFVGPNLLTENVGEEFVNDANLSSPDSKQKLAQATFGGGCFWCTEAVYHQFKGVHSVESGYAGGVTPNPSYEAVCSGTTGHAEVVQISYDPELLSYAQLLEIFWQSHDPTTLNQQGNDIGTQYRSIILYHDETQRELAEESIKQLNQAGVFGRPIVTQVVPYTEFYRAEQAHQDYYRSRGRLPYCKIVIQPKVEKIRQVFADKVHPLAD